MLFFSATRLWWVNYHSSHIKSLIHKIFHVISFNQSFSANISAKIFDMHSKSNTNCNILILIKVFILKPYHRYIYVLLLLQLCQMFWRLGFLPNPSSNTTLPYFVAKCLNRQHPTRPLFPGREGMLIFILHLEGVSADKNASIYTLWYKGYIDI